MYFFLPVCCTYRRREPERKRLEFSIVASLMLTKLYRTFFLSFVKCCVQSGLSRTVLSRWAEVQSLLP